MQQEAGKSKSEGLTLRNANTRENKSAGRLFSQINAYKSMLQFASAEILAIIKT